MRIHIRTPQPHRQPDYPALRRIQEQSPHHIHRPRNHPNLHAIRILRHRNRLDPARQRSPIVRVHRRPQRPTSRESRIVRRIRPAVTGPHLKLSRATLQRIENLDRVQLIRSREIRVELRTHRHLRTVPELHRDARAKHIRPPMSQIRGKRHQPRIIRDITKIPKPSPGLTDLTSQPVHKMREQPLNRH